MAHLFLTLHPRIVAPDGRSYRARACGDNGAGHWEGWLEFAPEDGSPILRTRRETTQPTVEDLEYWASGLTSIYLEGALKRARSAAKATSRRSRTGLRP